MGWGKWGGGRIGEGRKGKRGERTGERIRDGLNAVEGRLIESGGWRENQRR